MTSSDKFLLESKAWAKEKILLDTNFFQRLSDRHNPDVLWIDSSDSLVPVREVTNTDPGEILVYRNIGNQVRQDDISFMAVLEDALETSRVDMIVVCGYSHCSGIRDVLLGSQNKPTVESWLAGLRDIYFRNEAELNSLPFAQKEKRLSELNIHQQIVNLSELELVKRSWQRRNAPVLLGWYFDLATGELKEVFKMEPHNEMQKITAIVED
jgi:carbonic anhydrase